MPTTEAVWCEDASVEKRSRTARVDSGQDCRVCYCYRDIEEQQGVAVVTLTWLGVVQFSVLERPRVRTASISTTWFSPIAATSWFAAGRERLVLDTDVMAMVMLSTEAARESGRNVCLAGCAVRSWHFSYNTPHGRTRSQRAKGLVKRGSGDYFFKSVLTIDAIDASNNPCLLLRLFPYNSDRHCEDGKGNSTSDSCRLDRTRVETPQGSDRRFTTCFCSTAGIREESAQAEEQPQVMQRFHTASGTEDAKVFPKTSTKVPGAEHVVLSPTTEDAPPRQPQGRPPALLGDRGQPSVASIPIRLSSTKHQPPVRHPILLTGDALPDCTHSPSVAKAQPTQKPVIETESTCNDVPGVSGSTHTLQQTSKRFQKNFDFPLRYALQAENLEKARQGKIVGQSEALASHCLQQHLFPRAMRQLSQRLSPPHLVALHNRAPIVRSHWIAFRSLQTLMQKEKVHRFNTRADADAFALQLHELLEVQPLSAATKDEPDVLHWE
ncbi:hypothetical protein Efla_006706 [Eimeria flavescens]